MDMLKLKWTHSNQYSYTHSVYKWLALMNVLSWSFFG